MTKKKIPLVVNMACDGDIQCPVCEVFFNLYPLVAINWEGKCPNCRSEIEVDQNTIELSCIIRSRLNREERQKDNGVISRVQWHLDIPVCRILAGIKAHVATLSMDERWRLFHWLGCESAEELVQIMRELIRLRRKNKRPLKVV